MIKYRDILLNKKCLTHSMNRIQSKNQKIGTYEINKIYLSCFDGKIYILNNGYETKVTLTFDLVRVTSLSNYKIIVLFSL